MDFKNSRMIALIGAGLLGIGVFLPLVRVPKLGTLNYFNNGSGDGVIVLLLVGAAVALALLNRVKHVIWPGLLSLGLIGFSFIRLQSNLSDVRGVAGRDNPFADAAASAVQMEYGWAVLVIGAALIIAGGVIAWRG